MKMKIKNILGVVFMGVAVTSCTLDYEPLSDFTEITNGTTNTEEQVILKDKAAAEAQLKSLYELFRSRVEHWYLDKLLVSESHADNAYAGTTGAEVVPFENNSIDPSNIDLARDWNRFLEDIGQANVLICGVDKLYEKGQLSKEDYEKMRAQGCIFRGICMFDMARLWGSFPIITTIAEAITAENVEEVWPSYYPPKNTSEESFAQIISDFEYGEQHAPDFNNGDRTIMSKTVAQAFLAKVYAEKTARDYDKVIQYADKVINTPGLELEKDYETLWGFVDGDCAKRNTSEGILELHWAVGAGSWVSWMFGRSLENPEYYFTWAKWITPSRDLANAFDREGDKIRKDQTIHYEACTWSNYYPANNYAFMYKMRSGYNNIYKSRLADIILIKAEAEAYKGNVAEAVALVNQIRGRVGLKALSVGMSKDEAIAAVLNERRLELAMEGERWYDLCRNNKVEEVMNAVFAKDSGRLSQKKTFDANSYLLPLPQDAIDANDNLMQNPGY